MSTNKRNKRMGRVPPGTVFRKVIGLPGMARFQNGRLVPIDYISQTQGWRVVEPMEMTPAESIAIQVANTVRNIIPVHGKIMTNLGAQPSGYAVRGSNNRPPKKRARVSVERAEDYVDSILYEEGLFEDKADYDRTVDAVVARIKNGEIKLTPSQGEED